MLSEHEKDDDTRAAENVRGDLNDVQEEIAKMCSEANRKIVEGYLGAWNDGIEGFSQPKT